MVKRILVPFDNSKNSIRALKNAIYWAKLMRGEIILIHVISQNEISVVGPYRDRFVKIINEYMTKAQKYTSKYNVAVKSKILYGNITNEILSYAKKQRASLIILGKRGKGKTSKYYLGSVSNSLVHRSKIPIIIIS